MLEGDRVVEGDDRVLEGDDGVVEGDTTTSKKK